MTIRGQPEIMDLIKVEHFDCLLYSIPLFRATFAA
jgi:hypothetical protein